MRLGTVPINGKRWTVTKAARLGPSDAADWGQCDWDRTTIRIRQKLTPQQTRDTLIHELIHAQCPYLTEEAVEALERVLSDGLNLLGDP